MELWDLYDAQRIPLGKTHLRGNDFEAGTYHQVIGVWTIHKSGKVLLTQRDWQKSVCPGKWENTGGSVLSGESVIEACVREVKEETGLSIPPDQFRYLATIRTKEAFIDTYLAYTESDPFSVTLQAGETIHYQWLDLETLHSFVYSDDFAKPIVRQYEANLPKIKAFIDTLDTTIPAELKENASYLFESLGMTLQTALELFLKQSLREQALPFQPSLISQKDKVLTQTLAPTAENISYNDAFDASIGVEENSGTRYTYQKSETASNTPENRDFFDTIAHFALGNVKKTEEN